MKRFEALVLAVLLLIVGLSVTVYSVRSVEKSEPTWSHFTESAWSVSGFLGAEEILALDIKAGNDWGSIGPGDEFETFPAEIAVIILAPDGGFVRLIFNYSVQLKSPGAPSLEPNGLSVVEGNTTCLNVASFGTFGGYVKVGTVKANGVFSVFVDQVSIWENFLSITPPKRLGLRGYPVEFPYLVLLPIGCVFLLSSGAVFVLRVRRKKVLHHQKLGAKLEKS